MKRSFLSRMPVLRLCLPLLAMLLLLVGLNQLHAQVQSLTVVSVIDTKDTDLGDGHSLNSDVSLNGQLLVFESGAKNLDAGDTNDKIDIFLRNVGTKATKRISLSTDGKDPNGDSVGARISDDGKSVVYQTNASNIVANDMNNATDIILRSELPPLTVTRISKTSSGDETNGPSTEPAISADGRFVVYTSTASNIVANDANGKSDIFLYDKLSDNTECISINADEIPGNAESWLPSVSDDGRYVAFLSRAFNLVPGDTNGLEDVFVRDRTLGITRRVNVSAAGLQANGGTTGLQISGNGMFVAFTSLASNLLADDTNNTYDCFVKNLGDTGAIERVNLRPDGTQDLSPASSPTISADGRFVAFISSSFTLVVNKTTTVADVYVCDRGLSQVERVSVKPNGEQPNADCYYPRMSGNGRYVTFTSAAILEVNDKSDKYDIFVVDRGQILPVYKTDLLVNYYGSNVYNADGTNQTLTRQTAADGTIAFALRLENEGLKEDTFTVTGPQGGKGWTVRYFASANGVKEVTSQFANGGWVTPEISKGDYLEFRVEITPDATAPVATIKEFLITAVSNGDDQVLDAVLPKVEVQSARAYKPDIMVKSASHTNYLGDNIYDNGTRQTWMLNATLGTPMTFNVKVQNDGKSSDRLRVYSPYVSTYYATIKWYDSASGGTEITALVTGAGWNTATLSPGQSTELRCVLTPVLANVTYAFYVRVNSLTNTNTGDPFYQDEVDIVYNTLAKDIIPDAAVKAAADTSYNGDDIYNTSGLRQSAIAPAESSVATVFHVRLQNDGTPDNFLVTGTAGNGGWTIRYYDAIVGGKEITSQVTGAGWLCNTLGRQESGEYREIRVEMRAAVITSASIAMLTMTSVTDPTKRDTVKMIAALPTDELLTDLHIAKGGGARAIGDNIYNDLDNQTIWTTTPTMQPAVYDITIQNDGTLSDAFLITDDLPPIIIDHGDVGGNGGNGGSGGGGLPTPPPMPVPLAAATDPIEVLAFIKYADTSDTGEWTNVRASIASGVTNYHITETTTTVPEMLAEELVGKSIFLIPKQEYVYLSTILPALGTSWATVLNDYVSAGGLIVVMDKGGAETKILANANLLTASGYGYYYSYYTVTVDDINHPLMNGIPDTFYGGDSYYSAITAYTIEETDVEVVASYYDEPVVAVRAIGEGHVVLMGFDYNSTNTELDQLMVNTINWGATHQSYVTPPIWAITYTDAEGTDITEAVTGDGWTSPQLPAGASTTIRLTVTPSIRTDIYDEKEITVNAVSTTEPERADEVKTSTTRGSETAVPDMLIRTADETTYSGNYPSSDLTKYQSVETDVTAVYYCKVENDGTGPGSITITGPAGEDGWQVAYFDDTTAELITDKITGRGWVIPALAVGASKVIRVEVTPDDTVYGDDSFEIDLTANCTYQTYRSDTAYTNTSLISTRKIDMLIQGTADVDYLGGSISNTTGVDQTSSASIGNAKTTVYALKLLNAGNVSDAYTLKAPTAPTGWTIKYFDALTYGTDITDQVTGSGWSSSPISPGSTHVLRMEVTPAATAPGNATCSVLVTAKSNDGVNVIDAVRATTTVPVAKQPDMAIQVVDETTRVGDDVYGTEQLRWRYIYPGQSTTFLVTVQNDGNMPDTLRVTGAGLPAGWSATIFDGLTGANITTAIAGSGWTTPMLAAGASYPLRLRIQPGTAILSGTRAALALTACSVSQPSSTDTVQGVGVQAGRTTRFGLTVAGQQPTTESRQPVLSGNGVWLAFTSAASNLVEDDTNACADIFVTDQRTGVTTRVSVATGGIQADGPSSRPIITPDGRYIAFVSKASNLTANDTNHVEDVFLHDRNTGETVCVSRSINDVPGNQRSGTYGLDISADGQVVIFYSEASDLIADDRNSRGDIFRYNRMTGQMICCSVSSERWAANASSFWPSISADGMFITYHSTATNLVPGDTNNVSDIFVHNCMTHITQRVGLSPTGDQPNNASMRPSISADGRYIAFESYASNLVLNDTNNTADIFALDLRDGSIVRVSVATDGTQGNAASTAAAISDDGETIVFQSEANTLVPGDSNMSTDVFATSRAIRNLARISISSSNRQGGWTNLAPAVSGDGRYVAFESASVNLTEDDTNGVFDIFVRDRNSVPLTAVKLLVNPTTSPVEKTVTLTAQATGGTYVEYRFRAGYKQPDGSWRFVELTNPIYRSSNSCTWTPREAHTYTLEVWAREAGSTNNYDVNNSMSYTVMPSTPVTGVTLQVSPSPYYAGTPLTLTATASGAAQPEYRYRVGYPDATGVYRWTDISSPLFQASNTCTWTPPDAHRWMLVVYARQQGSTAYYEATTAKSILVNPPSTPVTGVTLQVSPSPYHAGTPLTLTATASGAAQPEYRFRVGYPDATGVYRWTDISSPLFQASNTCTWTPPDARRWMLKVYARQQGSTALYEATTAKSISVSP